MEQWTTHTASMDSGAHTSNREVDVLIIGAGPTGLGAAKRLNQIVSGGSKADYFSVRIPWSI